MAEIIVKDIGPNQMAVIKVYKEATGVGVREAHDAVCEGAPLKVTVDSDSVRSVTEMFRRVGATVAMATDGRFDKETSFQEANSQMIMQTTESPDKDSDDTENRTSFHISEPQNREETLSMLFDVGSIAETVESLMTEIGSIEPKIEPEREKAEKLRRKVSGKVQAIKWIAIVCSCLFGDFLGMAIFGEDIGGIVALAASIAVWILMNKTIVKNYLQEHEEENNANADNYIKEYVEPLENRLKEVKAELAKIEASGQIEWAKDIVGERMFSSLCVGDLYDLVKSRRADSLKEALNLYDDIQHKARVEEGQAAIQRAAEKTADEAAMQTVYIKRIARNTAWNAYNTRQIDKNTRRFRR